MANTAKVLFRGAATTNTATTLYTVPSATTTIVTSIGITNTASSEGSFTLALGGVNFGTTVSVPANDSILIDLKQVLVATNTISGGASATTINFHISGVEIA
jgi:hypothetical protein